MQPSQRVRDAVNRLGADNDFTALVQYLNEVRDEHLVQLEDANQAIQVHKLQGYCQALRDFIEMCQRK